MEIGSKSIITKEDPIIYGGYSVITKEDLEIYSFCIDNGLNYDEIYSKIKNKNTNGINSNTL